MNRRAQQPITIRSDRAAARLKLLTQAGRSQASIIEEALERLPLQDEPRVRDAHRKRVRALVERIAAKPRRSMAEFDQDTYDERGLPR